MKLLKIFGLFILGCIVEVLFLLGLWHFFGIQDNLIGMLSGFVVGMVIALICIELDLF